ncbi:hypothetical protein D3C84_659950 [compost metagenome]
MDGFAQFGAGDADKAPGLHQADAGRLVRRFEQAPQQRRFDRATAEMTHVATLGDGAIHRIALGRTEGVVSHGFFTVSRSGANSAAIADGLDGK